MSIQDARARALYALATGGTLAAQAESEDSAHTFRISESREAMAQFNEEQRALMAEQAAPGSTKPPPEQPEPEEQHAA